MTGKENLLHQNQITINGNNGSFLQMLEKGIAYQEEAEVNWDPVDQTVLGKRTSY